MTALHHSASGSTNGSDLLNRIPLISSLPRRVRLAVEDRSFDRSYRRGDPVFWQGDRLKYLPVLAMGHAKLIRNTETGREIVVDILGPGDTPCWSEVLRAEPTPLTLVPVENTKVEFLPVTPVRMCVSSDPRCAMSFAEQLGTQYSGLLEQLSETRAPSVPARLGGLLLHLLERHGDMSDGDIPIRLTRQDLADAAGTTNETTIRLMRKWEKAGLIETRRDGFKIFNQHGLRAVADGADL